MSLCCRRIHQNTQQVTAPTTPINSKWSSTGVRTVCIVSGGIVGAIANVYALAEITTSNRIPYTAIPSFIDCSSLETPFLCIEAKIAELVVTYGVLPGAIMGHFVANWILGEPHST